jgi:hypothetical protein
MVTYTFLIGVLRGVIPAVKSSLILDMKQKLGR